jgi:ubiquinone/menaquinone biosynthesis C-methylase UbiE
MRRSHELVEQAFGPDVVFERVLEVGAGSGVHIRSVKHAFNEYFLTDFSTDMLGHIEPTGNGGKVTVLAQDATSLSFPDDSFDRVIATHVLEHLYKPHQVLREWARVLKPGGTLSLVLPCDPGLMWRFGRYFGPRKQARKNGLAYDYVMAREHVNSITNLVTFVRYYFDERQEYWWPFRAPSTDLNLIYAVNVTG